MFPSVVFRRAYDAVQLLHPGAKGDLEYLRVLHLAASTIEADVTAALELLLADGKEVSSAAVKALTSTAGRPELPVMAVPVVDLRAYDELLTEVAS